MELTTFRFLTNCEFWSFSSRRVFSDARLRDLVLEVSSRQFGRIGDGVALVPQVSISILSHVISGLSLLGRKCVL